VKQQSSTVVRRCMLLLALLPSATALAQKTTSHFARPKQSEAVPFIDIISPTAARLHDSGFILILDGAGFGPDAEIGFRLGNINHPLRTVVVNEGEVAAWVPGKLLHEAATASITVTNHQRHGESVASNPVLLSITKPTASVAFSQTDIDLGQSPGATGVIVTADFNGDGQPDLAVSEPCEALPLCSTESAGNVTILLGRPDGTFFVASSVAVSNLPKALATGDFNGDGKIDIAVANYGATTVTILLNDGHGGFTPAASTVPVDRLPNSIAVGDFNQDGKLDLAVANSVADCTPAPVGCTTNAVSIRLGRGDGTFVAAPSITGTGATNDRVTTVDLNRDGILDLVLDVEANPSVLVYLGQGDGTFSAIASPPTLAYEQPGSFGDVNRDGKLDLVGVAGIFPDFNQSILATFLGNGDGLFHAGPQTPVAEDLVAGGLLADFNGDGKLDLVGAGFPDDHYDLFLGNGHGAFKLTSSTPVNNISLGGPVVGDFNGDGKLDMVTMTGVYQGGTVSILLQQ
jgi:FG-GAP-like repeat/FG-GAP repeat